MPFRRTTENNSILKKLFFEIEWNRYFQNCYILQMILTKNNIKAYKDTWKCTGFGQNMTRFRFEAIRNHFKTYRTKSIFANIWRLL